MFFRLLPEVYLIIGKHKSLLQNILNKKIFWLDNNIAQNIQFCENNNPIPNKFLKYAQELQNNEWGLITFSPIFVDKLRLLDMSDNRQFHKKPPVVAHATIKLTDKCNLDCEECQKIFCPSCIKDNDMENLSLQKLKSLGLKIKNYGCKTFFLTGGEISLFPNLKEIYDFLIKNGLNVILFTNGIKKLDNYFYNSNIVISAFSKKSLSKIINNYKNFKNITICTYFRDNQNLMLPENWKHIKRSYTSHKITQNSLVYSDIQKFHLIQTKNICLNGKIVINQSGNVFPCLEAIKHKKVVGNINYDKWEDIITKLISDFWNKKIDDHKICRTCEFRYVCISCMFDDIKQNCLYDLEAKSWR